MPIPNLKSLLGHSSLTGAFVGADENGNIIFINEDGSAVSLGAGLIGRLANQLRDETGFDGEIRVLKGFSVDGDGGGGNFQWSDTPAIDDGGTILNDGGFGANEPGWRRIFSGPIDALWFGAIGNGSTNGQEVALNRTILAAVNRQKISAATQVSQPDVVFPAGVYRIAASVSLINYFGRLHAEGAVLYSSDPAVDLLTNVGKWLCIRGVTFEGGRDSILVETGNLDTVTIDITACSFKNVGGKAIKADLTSNSTILNIRNNRFTHLDGKTDYLIDCGSCDHVNIVGNWFTSDRPKTILHRDAQLRIFHNIFIPGGTPTNPYWIENTGGSIWVLHNHFGGEGAGRRLLLNSAGPDNTNPNEIHWSANTAYCPSTQNPFTFTAVPNLVDIDSIMGISDGYGLSGGGVHVEGYQSENVGLGSFNYSNILPLAREFSADSDLVTVSALLGTKPLPSAPALQLDDAAMTLEAFGAGDTDYAVNTSSNLASTSTVTNAFGHNMVRVLATSSGASYNRQYTDALAVASDGTYTLQVEVDVVVGHASVTLEIADARKIVHLAVGRHVLSLPCVYISGVTSDDLDVVLRDLPNGADVRIGPPRVYVGHAAPVEANAKYLGTAAPTGTSRNRYLVGDIVWNAQPVAGGPIAFICVASSARTAAKTFDAGTWVAAGHSIPPGAAGSIPVSDGANAAYTITPRLSASGFIEFGASAAGSGFIRAPNNTTVVAVKGAVATNALTLVGDSSDQAKLTGGTNAYLLAGSSSYAAGLGNATIGLIFSAENTALISYVGGFAIAQTVASPEWGPLPKTTNDNPTDWKLKGQTAFAGSADNGGYINLEGGTADGAGEEGGVRLIDGAGGNRLVIDAYGVGFNNTAPITPSITGALSTVADAPAKAVLTSIIAALAASGVGLVTDGTT
jgi:hypothetical protein